MPDDPVWQQLQSYCDDQQPLPFKVAKRRGKWTSVILTFQIAGVTTEVVANLPTLALKRRNNGSKPVCYVHQVNKNTGRVTVGLTPAATKAKSFADFISKYTVGDSITGIVTNVVDYGVFVSCDGLTGLLHRSEIPDNLDFKHEFNKGDTIEVTVIKLDHHKQRVGFGYFHHNH